MQKELLKQLHERPIAYYPIYRKLTGSTTAGILLSQLMYWFSIQDRFYKTDKEIKEETLLTDKELRTAKKKIKEIDFIKVTVEGVPAKTYYEIDWDIYSDLLIQTNTNNTELKGTNKYSPKGQTNIAERDKLKCPKGTNKYSPKGQTITKNTTKNTTKTTTREKEKSIKKNNIHTLMNSKTMELMKNLNVDENFIKEILEYRKAIKKPIATSYALNLLLNSILKVVLKYQVAPEQVFEFLAGKQWQSIKAEWEEVKNEFSKTQINNSYLSEAGQATAQNAMDWLAEEEAKQNTIDSGIDYNF
jgi:hypothetical protein